MRTSRGRMATKTAWLHFGLEAPKNLVQADDLFNDTEE